MFEVRSEASFSAAHHLNNYEGPCENVHGHNWLVRATVRCSSLNKSGIGIDFKILKGALKSCLDELDHADLNAVFQPLDINPSSENIARYVFLQLKKEIDDKSCSVWCVEVFETPGNCASYFEHD